MINISVGEIILNNLRTFFIEERTNEQEVFLMVSDNNVPGDRYLPLRNE